MTVGQGWLSRGARGAWLCCALLAGAVLPDFWLGTGKMAHRPLLVSAELTRWLFRSQVRGGTLQPFAA